MGLNGVGASGINLYDDVGGYRRLVGVVGADKWMWIVLCEYTLHGFVPAIPPDLKGMWSGKGDVVMGSGPGDMDLARHEENGRIFRVLCARGKWARRWCSLV